MTREEHRVEAVSRCAVNNRNDWWAVDVIEPGGKRVRHAFPPETLHWRAAEYGYDPTDVDTLLDVVLHERHVRDHTSRDPDFVYNCDRDTARAALDSRLKQVRARVQITDPDSRLTQIVAAHVHDSDSHAKLLAYADHVRQHGTNPHRETERT